VFSFESNCRLDPVFGNSMNPLFEDGDVIQPCTAAVTSTEMKLNAVVAATPVATGDPVEGGVLPLTASSPQVVEALTVSILIEPDAPTWSRNSVRVAFWTWPAVTLAGRLLRSNCTNPMLAELPTVTVAAVPKLEELPGT